MAETHRYYGTGKRKNAIARVWLSAGDGSLSVNHKETRAYFGRQTLEALVMQPLEATDSVGKYNIFAKTRGGGISGQAGALRHGIAKALVAADPDLRPTLRKLGYLTRDPRVKERKKYGRKRARRGFQFSKR
jgi:small subunit ribosomal protein S9